MSISTPAHLRALLQTDIRNHADRNVLVDALIDEDLLDEAAAVRRSWRSINSNYSNFDADEAAIVGLLIVDRDVNATDIGNGYALVRTLDGRYAVIWGNLHSGEGHVLSPGNEEFGASYGDGEEGCRIFQTEIEAKCHLAEIGEAMLSVPRTAVEGFELLGRINGIEHSREFVGLCIDSVRGTDGWHAWVRDSHHDGTILSWSDTKKVWSILQIDQTDTATVENIMIVRLAYDQDADEGMNQYQLGCDLNEGLYVIDQEVFGILAGIYGEENIEILYQQKGSVQ